MLEEGSPLGHGEAAVLSNHQGHLGSTRILSPQASESPGRGFNHQGHLGSTLILSPQASESPGRQPFRTLYDHRSSPLAHNDGHLFPSGHSDPQVHLGIAHQWGQG